MTALSAAPVTRAVLDERRNIAMAKRVVALDDEKMFLQWYLALDEAARKAFDALAEIVEDAAEGDACPVCEYLSDIARAALPEGWVK